MFLLAMIISSVMVVVIMVHDQILKAETIVAGFSTDMNDVFENNENMAIALSSKYLELSGKNCSPSDFGVGFLVNGKQVSPDYKCMLSSLEFVNKKITDLKKLIYFCLGCISTHLILDYYIFFLLRQRRI